MGKSKNATKPLTHEEIWDDSALVRSWDEAVEEYKLYHSIHAKGENVDDVLRETQSEEHEEEEVDQNDAMETELDAPLGDSAVDTDKQAEVEVEQHIRPPQPEGGDQVPAALGAMPQAALSQVQDEGLKNLMMAWYFAGYYTGLYEGQQRASQNKGS